MLRWRVSACSSHKEAGGGLCTKGAVQWARPTTAPGQTALLGFAQAFRASVDRAPRGYAISRFPFSQASVSTTPKPNPWTLPVYRTGAVLCVHQTAIMEQSLQHNRNLLGSDLDIAVISQYLPSVERQLPSVDWQLLLFNRTRKLRAKQGAGGGGGGGEKSPGPWCKAGIPRARLGGWFGERTSRLQQGGWGGAPQAKVEPNCLSTGTGEPMLWTAVCRAGRMSLASGMSCW